jgi:hypothetical protein
MEEETQLANQSWSRCGLVHRHVGIGLGCDQKAAPAWWHLNSRHKMFIPQTCCLTWNPGWLWGQDGGRDAKPVPLTKAPLRPCDLVTLVAREVTSQACIPPGRESFQRAGLFPSLLNGQYVLCRTYIFSGRTGERAEARRVFILLVYLDEILKCVLVNICKPLHSWKRLSVQHHSCLSTVHTLV